MPNKRSGFVAPLRWLGQDRALVVCEGVNEDFACEYDSLRDLWEQAAEKSTILRGMKVSHSIDSADNVVLFSIEGYSDAHSEIVSQLRHVLGVAASDTEAICKATLRSPIESVNVAETVEEAVSNLNRHIQSLQEIAEMDVPVEEVASK